MEQTTLDEWRQKLPKNWSEIVLAMRGWLLFLCALPAIPATMIALARNNLPGIIANAAGLAALLLAFVLLRRGFRNEHALRTQKLARPFRPLKTISALITATATTGLAWFGAGHTLTVSVLFGLGALLGMYLAYGFEPRSVQAILPDIEGIDREEILRLLEDAQQRVFGIEKAGKAIRNPELNTRLTRISTLAKDILNDLSEDPRDVRRSKKFLNVYLDGVEKVVTGYAKTHTQAGSEQLEDNFRNVLVAIEDTFEEQRKKLIDNDVFDLDVQMEVLATQLKREGIM